MCGIVGIFHSRDKRPIDRELLSRMNDTQVHRGPDGFGLWDQPGLGFGHRRLSIIDLAAGHQPMLTQDGGIGVTFNGEIYNYRELKQQLEALGHHFQTHSDTEVILHGWRQWGADCVQHFRGMFAFALYDVARETLFMARDPMGKKPLHYSLLADGACVFGSELKSLLPFPGMVREIEPLAIEEYLAFGYIPDPRSIYKNILKLPAAHRLIWRRGDAAPRIDAYWDVKFADVAGTHQATAEELVAQLREAVDLRMIADVPLGAFLSGGVDSSCIVALMAGLSSTPVKTFSMGFADKAFDETSYAQQMATRYHTDHHSRIVDPDSIDLVGRLIDFYDEPFGDSSAMPTFRLCALARENVTVALSGDGGDELFAGYRRYLFHARQEQLRAWLPPGVRKILFGALGAIYPKLDWAPRYLRAKNTFQELGADSAGGFFASVSVMNDDMRARLRSQLQTRALAGYHPSNIIRTHMNAAGTDDVLAQAQYADIKTWLPGDILTKVDRASMANSLEVRCPMLDFRFAQWSAGIRPDQKLHGGVGKYLLKKACEPYVSDDILYRPKQGFSIPLAAWFRGPLRQKLRDTVGGPILADSGYFNPGALIQLVDEHQSGRRDHSPALWLLLMLEAFLRRETGAA